MDGLWCQFLKQGTLEEDQVWMGQMANSTLDIIRTGNRRFEIMYVYMQYLDEQTGVEREK